MASPADPTQELITFFHTKGRKRVYKKGEIILHAGDTPQGMYLIEWGYVKVYALSKQGTERTHMFYRSGDIFPMLWAFKDAVRNVYYEALEPVTIWVIPRDDFMQFIISHPEANMKLLQQVVEMFRVYAGRIDNLLYPNSYDRTAYCLLSLMSRYGDKIPEGWVINAPITHQDIANAVNLSRETVSRSLERLQRKGIVSHDKHRRIVVKDIAALVNIIGQEEILSMWPQYAEYLV